MNRFLNGISAVIAVLCACTFISCDGKEDIPVIEYKDVTANNLRGEWEQVSINGEPMKEGTFFHITFITKDTEYVIEHNLSSSSSSSYIEKGVFGIETDDNGALIRGINVVFQNWSQKYYVRDLTDSSMKWVGKTDGEVKIFRRIK